MLPLLARSPSCRYTEIMPDHFDASLIQADFDRLAALSREGWDHNSHYHRFLLKHVPVYCSKSLELGCGTGTFARLLATRAQQVLALDLSPQMIRIARERSLQYANIDFQVADALSWEFPHEQFDCIISIATLHHLPLEEMLIKMKSALTVNGILLVLDLYQASLADVFTSLAAFPVHLVLKYHKTGRFKEPQEVRAAWAEHGQHDSYLTFSQLRHRYQAILPGAKMRKHLLWRYSLIWKKAPVS
jgi:ubiquinone/menaquinone biosynthesis C-methylase UbiE